MSAETISEALKEKFSRHFSKYGELTAEEKAAIHESMQVKTFDRGRILVSPGEMLRETYFILEGLVRSYYLTGNDEVTTAFFAEEEWVLSPGDGETAQPSPTGLVCMERTLVVTGNEKTARQLFEKFPRFESVAMSIVQEAFFAQQTRHTEWISQSAEQRYLTLINQHPALLQRVSQYHIASYIGVKPESLSRIRKRIAGQI
ncbi:MAG: Crp/Fnr family transcriptional regulator [Bacteroidetes bacterium]|nr:Crp/Fnr family transcriptional regulator [Bacteroidota bacterium]